MSSAPAPDAEPGPDPVATALADADLLRVAARPTGDAVAAAGLLARAARATDTPFHVRTTWATTVPAGDGRAVSVGWDAPDAVGLSTAGGRPLSVAAAAAVRSAGLDPDPVLALAGTVAAGADPGVVGARQTDASGTADDAAASGTGTLVEAATRHDAVERRPGVAAPTPDPVDGLVHSTLAWTPVAGDRDAAAALVREAGGAVSDGGVDADEVDPEVRRTVASVVALDATADAPSRAVAAVERALRPYVTPAGPFETVGGFGDVLAATARTDPGRAVALAVGADGVAESALARWRAHGRTVHALSSSPRTARYDGVSVVRVDPDAAPDDGVAVRAALPAVARLASAFHAPEPTTLVVGGSSAVVVTTASARTARDLLATAVAAATDATDAGDTSGADPRVVGGARLAELRPAVADEAETAARTTEASATDEAATDDRLAIDTTALIDAVREAA
ncbi:hypothetical protein RYH80_14545, partial [Halobaculum sp. MBLA0147]|uniref:hypothetical protein n=1 Tax=Halobaculum sp. MBLA0147 TaxID=3079934 RepID=UPI0035249E22